MSAMPSRVLLVEDDEDDYLLTSELLRESDLARCDLVLWAAKNGFVASTWFVCVNVGSVTLPHR